MILMGLPQPQYYYFLLSAAVLPGLCESRGLCHSCSGQRHAPQLSLADEERLAGCQYQDCDPQVSEE